MRESTTDYMIMMPYFEEFFAAYPKREGHDPAYLAYIKAVKMGFATHDELVIGAKRYSLVKGDKQYKVQPAKWLEEKRWKDDMPKLPNKYTGHARKTKIIKAWLSSHISTSDKAEVLKQYTEAEIKNELMRLEKNNIERAKLAWDNLFRTMEK